MGVNIDLIPGLLRECSQRTFGVVSRLVERSTSLSDRTAEEGQL